MTRIRIPWALLVLLLTASGASAEVSDFPQITWKFQVDIITGSRIGETWTGSLDLPFATFNTRGAVDHQPTALSFTFAGRSYFGAPGDRLPLVRLVDGVPQELVGTAGLAEGYCGFSQGFPREQFVRPAERFFREGQPFFAYLEIDTGDHGAGTVTFLPQPPPEAHIPGPPTTGDFRNLSWGDPVACLGTPLEELNPDSARSVARHAEDLRCWGLTASAIRYALVQDRLRRVTVSIPYRYPGDLSLLRTALAAQYGPLTPIPGQSTLLAINQPRTTVLVGEHPGGYEVTLSDTAFDRERRRQVDALMIQIGAAITRAQRQATFAAASRELREWLDLHQGDLIAGYEIQGPRYLMISFDGCGLMGFRDWYDDRSWWERLFPRHLR